MPERSSIPSEDAEAAALGRRGGLKGGPARAASLSSERRSEIARLAAQARWAQARGEPPASTRLPMEGAFASAEERWRVLVEQIPAVVYIDALDENATTVYISPQIASILGYPMVDWKSDSGLWFRSLHEEDRDAAFDRYMKERESSDRWTMEYRMLSADGRVVWIREEDQVIRDQSGERLAVQGVMYDVTRQKEDEKRLRELDAMKEALLRAVAHDLGGPLSSVMGASLLMTDDTVEMTEEDRQLLLRGVASSAKKMNRILTSLLDMDRLDRGILTAKVEPVDLAHVAEQVMSELSLPSGREVVTDFEEITVSADAGLAERIMENLVLNAIRHTPSDACVWFRVRASIPADGSAIIEVVDDGPGVPPELRGEIFEPFRRAAVEGVPGAGIGLSLVARFAHLQGGRAWVEEAPGGGACFRVWLPGSSA